MLNRCFIETKEYGIIYYDRILCETTYPILFTCKNSKGELFLCVCCQNNKDGRRWLLGKTTAANIIAMLKNSISVRNLLLDYTTEKITIEQKNNSYEIRNAGKEWATDSRFLPKTDSYLDPEDNEFDDEIKYFSKQEIINMSMQFGDIKDYTMKTLVDTRERYFVTTNSSVRYENSSYSEVHSQCISLSEMQCSLPVDVDERTSKTSACAA